MLESGKPVVVWEGRVYYGGDPPYPDYRVVLVRYSDDPENLVLAVEERTTDAMGAQAWVPVRSASNAWWDTLARALEALHCLGTTLRAEPSHTEGSPFLGCVGPPPGAPETWDECLRCPLTAVGWGWAPEAKAWAQVCQRHGAGSTIPRQSP